MKIQRSLFFCHVHQQFGTGAGKYHNLTESIVTLLQVHAEHETQRLEKEK